MVTVICVEQNIGGSRGRAPLRVQILSFRHTKFSKRNRLGSPHPPHEVHAPPPTGNPGSATAKPLDVTFLFQNFFLKSTFHSMHIDAAFPTITHNHMLSLSMFLLYCHKNYSSFSTFNEKVFASEISEKSAQLVALTVSS